VGALQNTECCLLYSV